MSVSDVDDNSSRESSVSLMNIKNNNDTSQLSAFNKLNTSVNGLKIQNENIMKELQNFSEAMSSIMIILNKINGKLESKPKKIVKDYNFDDPTKIRSVDDLNNFNKNLKNKDFSDQMVNLLYLKITIF